MTGDLRTNIIIISKDTGFDPLIKHQQQLGRVIVIFRR